MNVALAHSGHHISTQTTLIYYSIFTLY